MKICWRGFLGKNHSWAIVAQNLCRQFIRQGHQVDMFSTNGIQFFPDDLRSSLVGYTEENSRIINGTVPSNDYDMALSYTAPHNWQPYLAHGKIKFGIWAMETEGKGSLPRKFVNSYQYTTKILAPSNFCKNVFAENGTPDSYLEVIPHGYDNEFTDRKDVFDLKTDRRFKFLITLGQLHCRKNIRGILEAWGRAFTNQDDVILVAKLNLKQPKNAFDEDWNFLYSNFKSKYPKSAPIMVIGGFIPYISDLHRATDALLSLSHGEGFFIPALNSLISKKITICSNNGGNLDFCNDTNALLIKGKTIRAPFNYQYWEPSPNAMMFDPDLDHAVELMRLAYSEEKTLSNKLNLGVEDLKARYSWHKIAERIIELARVELDKPYTHH